MFSIHSELGIMKICNHKIILLIKNDTEHCYINHVIQGDRPSWYNRLW